MELIPGTAVYDVIILGSSQVGKTSIAWRYVNEEFLIDPIPTRGVEFLTKMIPEPHLRVRLTISVTGGNERYADILFIRRRVYGALLVYDIHDRRSYEVAKAWAAKLKAKLSPWIVLALVGHKVDVLENRVVSTEEAAQFAKENGLIFLEASAQEDINITKCFLDIG
ncbi:uncharacterized protein [Drosophila bipectinata]|uniref:uncharacterized protein isoform X3 n=1 Tax=Drosophila bipectinata TaxID=42026 RepID=UPI0038B36F34